MLFRSALREKVRGILTTEQKEFIERGTMLHGQASVEVSEQFASRFAGAKGNKEDYAAAQKEFQTRLREEYLRKLDTIMSPEQKTALRERAELEAKREAEAANAPKKKGNN